MKKLVLALGLLTANVLISHSGKAQSSLTEIQQVPPAVKQTWAYWMNTVYINQFGRYGVTTWYMDKGTFESITVFRSGSTFIRLFMRFTPQGQLLSAETDL